MILEIGGAAGGAGGAGGGGGIGAGSAVSVMETSSVDIGSGKNEAMSASPSSAGCHGMDEMSRSPGKISSLSFGSWDGSSEKPKKSR